MEEKQQIHHFHNQPRNKTDSFDYRKIIDSFDYRITANVSE